MSTATERSLPDELRPIVEQLVPSVVENESWEDIWAGVVYLAARRASLLGEELNSLDLLRMIYLLGFCPFIHFPFSQEYEQELVRARQYVFEGAAAGQRDRIDACVPDGSILLEFDAMGTLHARQELDGFLRLPPDLAHPTASSG
jgi:hypothetical protein